MLPLKRTSSERDDSSQNSLNVGDGFIAGAKWSPRTRPETNGGLLKHKIQKHASLNTTICSLQTSPITGNTVSKMPTIFTGSASLNATPALGITQPSLLALRHQFLPNKVYCMPDFSSLISKELIELSLKTLLLRAATV